ncbi:hypothetical protein SAMN05192560_0459 [Methylobacillus rhizosphaerae]|uniref:Uncharacterized protein n=2 Tax=Methylobacillus rhizosphaerae TaxID=551994 RepID=A0A238YAQ0_9PROT|nr:hypothetical protein SAMN05192560_0459 [Methylobacillus rhizosphaerae]
MDTTLLPDNATHVIVSPSPTLSQVRNRHKEASQAHSQAVALWHKRIFIAQCIIAGALFFKWIWSHSLLGSAFMAILMLIPLSVLHLLVGLFTHNEKKQQTEASTALANTRKDEVEEYLASMGKGRYQWIQRNGEYLAILPDAALLYYFGSLSKDQHVVLDPSRTVLETRVTAEQHVSHNTTSSTVHDRRTVLMASKNIGMVGKGKSTTQTTTHTTITHTYTLEVQVQLAKGQQPFWISLPFGQDDKNAENWKVLINQMR